MEIKRVIFLSTLLCIQIFGKNSEPEIFTARPAKKQSNNALKESILERTKQIMHEINEMIRALSSQDDYLLIQLQNMADGTSFFAQADNKDLTMCVHELEKLSALLQQTRLQIIQQTHHAFAPRKK